MSRAEQYIVLTHRTKCDISEAISLQEDISFKPAVTLYLCLIFFQELKVCFDKNFTHRNTNSMLITLRS